MNRQGCAQSPSYIPVNKRGAAKLLLRESRSCQKTWKKNLNNGDTVLQVFLQSFSFMGLD